PDNLHNIKGIIELILTLESHFDFDEISHIKLVRLHLHKVDRNHMNGKDYREMLLGYDNMILPCVNAERRNILEDLFRTLMEISFLAYVRDRLQSQQIVKHRFCC